MGRPRLLDVGDRRPQDFGKWLVVADAPLDRFGEQAINRGLTDLAWVARAAVAHEAMVESFTEAPAVLPMKLFTIFNNDARARDHVRSTGRRIDALIRRVSNHREWGVRVVFDRAAATVAARRTATTQSARGSGKSYLLRKKKARDAAAELARNARDVVADLYDRLAAQADSATRRRASDLPVQTGPLLLDAAFLVPTGRSKRFSRLVARESRTLGQQGYRVTLTGPWPAYSFVEG
jgi:hypothetical protein